MPDSTVDMRTNCDPANASITLQTLERAALALGKQLKIELA